MSRIQPAPDQWDEEALEKYRLMLRGLRERGLTAMVTLHHFTDPLWLAEQGGWESDDYSAKVCGLCPQDGGRLERICHHVGDDQ